MKLQPVGEQRGEKGEFAHRRGLVYSHVRAVGAEFEDVQFHGDAGGLQGLVKLGGVARVDRLVSGGGVDEAGTGVGGDMLERVDGIDGGLRGVRADEGLQGNCAGAGVEIQREYTVGNDGEVGAVGDAVDGIGGGGIARLVRGGHVCGEMASGGESPDADLAGVHAQLRGVRADVADGARGVEHGRGVCVCGREPVLQHKGGDAMRDEPARLGRALLLHDLMGIASAGHHDNGAVQTGSRNGVCEELGSISLGCSLRQRRARGPQNDGIGEAGWRGSLRRGDLRLCGKRNGEEREGGSDEGTVHSSKA